MADKTVGGKGFGRFSRQSQQCWPPVCVAQEVGGTIWALWVEGEGGTAGHPGNGEAGDGGLGGRPRPGALGRTAETGIYAILEFPQAVWPKADRTMMIFMLFHGPQMAV